MISLGKLSLLRKTVVGNKFCYNFLSKWSGSEGVGICFNAGLYPTWWKKQVQHYTDNRVPHHLLIHTILCLLFAFYTTALRRYYIVLPWNVWYCAEVIVIFWFWPSIHHTVTSEEYLEPHQHVVIFLSFLTSSLLVTEMNITS